MFAVYVVGLHISVPGVDAEILAPEVRRDGNCSTLFDAFTGGAFKRYTIFAMGIMPYINASIIMQLLTIAIPNSRNCKRGSVGTEEDQLVYPVAHRHPGFVQAIGTTKC